MYRHACTSLFLYYLFFRPILTENRRYSGDFSVLRVRVRRPAPWQTDLLHAGIWGAALAAVHCSGRCRYWQRALPITSPAGANGQGASFPPLTYAPSPFYLPLFAPINLTGGRTLCAIFAHEVCPPVRSCAVTQPMMR